MKSFTGILIFVLLLAGCGSSDPEPLAFTDQDSGSEIVIETGDRFEIRLESNPSAGFEWQVYTAAPAEIYELRSSSFEEPADASGVGSPGTDVYLFEANGPGAAVLRFEYLQPSDDPPIPERIAEYIVRIDGTPWPPVQDDAGE